MKITGLSHLYEWENFAQLTKYFFSPIYINMYILYTMSIKHSGYLIFGVGSKRIEEPDQEEPLWVHRSLNLRVLLYTVYKN